MRLPRDPTLRRWLALSPAMLTIGIFMIIPMCILLVFSFMEADPYGGVDPGFTVEAYIQILFERDFDDLLQFDPIYLNIIGRSIVLAGFATLGCLVLGLPVAYYMTRQTPRVQSMMLFLIIVGDRSKCNRWLHVPTGLKRSNDQGRNGSIGCVLQEKMRAAPGVLFRGGRSRNASPGAARCIR